MPRPPRIHVDGGFYHVILRGNHREDIFFSASDRQRFAQLVAETIDRFRMRVHAYCWMTNHVHLLMQVGEIPLGRALLRIASRYAREAQRRRVTTGHLFERRYRAILVDADCYFLELIRYIHLNPVRAGLVADPENYRWSGHRTLLGLESTPWLTTHFALDYFGVDLASARQAYRCFVLSGLGIDAGEELSRGRIDEPRVLGDDRFMAGVLMHSRPAGGYSIEALTEKICRLHGADPAALIQPGRRRQPARLRALVIHHALDRRIATLRELARHFGRSASTLSETLGHYRRTEPALFTRPLDIP
ncbi:MAG TPA: transposase [Gammaproteobacteria bacterium]|nr:transposase [Gammaproteobacteria bacterium]